MAEDINFEIPDEQPDPNDPLELWSFADALRERKDLASRFPSPRREFFDWLVRFCLKPLLFLFVVVLNVWWDVNVRDMIWQSGRTATGFHLDNTVTVALVTTSMANFLGLVIIIAKHLYPTPKDK